LEGKERAPVYVELGDCEAKYVHCDDVWWTAFVCLLVFGAPGADSISEVMAPELDLGVVAHLRLERYEDSV